MQYFTADGQIFWAVPYSSTRLLLTAHAYFQDADNTIKITVFLADDPAVIA